MSDRPDRPHRVGVVKWAEEDRLCEVIADELAALGHTPVVFCADSNIPTGLDMVFSYGPYGDFLALAAANARLGDRRPVFMHWNTEGIPDPRLPWGWVRGVSATRSLVGRVLGDSPWRNRMARLRYLGDYLHAYRRGWLDVFATSSSLHAAMFSRRGLPAVFAPWGSTRRWHADLGLERDIDVLWLGARATRRRSALLDTIRAQLRRRSSDIYVVDGVEHPFEFGLERTRLLNRARITLNLTRARHDDNYSRLMFAASNRSLVVSEPLLPHCPQYQAGVHYVSAPPQFLGDTILDYLDNPHNADPIVHDAYELVTETLPFRATVARIVDAAETHVRVCDSRH